MRVLHLIDHLGLGGAQSALLDLLEVRGDGIEAVVASLGGRVLPHHEARLAACGVRLERLDFRNGNILAPLKLRRCIRSRAPDLLHTHLQNSNHIGGAVALTLPRPRPVVVTHVHNDPRRGYGWGHRLAGRLLRGVPDAHVAPGAGAATALRATFGRVRRVEVIPNGIDLGRFAAARPDPAAVAALRAGAEPVIGTLGRLARPKGLDVLLEALPRLRESLPGVRLLVVGDGPMRRGLEAQATRLGLAGAVAFAGYRDDVETAYAAMDVFVFPSRSRYESQGIALVEAMAMGVPVVGTRVSGIVDVVEDGRTGLLVPPEDPAALAEAVRRLLADAGLKQALRERARQGLAARFSRETMAARIEALYRDLLAARARAVDRGHRPAPTGQPD